MKDEGPKNIKKHWPCSDSALCGIPHFGSFPEESRCEEGEGRREEREKRGGEEEVRKEPKNSLKSMGVRVAVQKSIKKASVLQIGLPKMIKRIVL